MSGLRRLLFAPAALMILTAFQLPPPSYGPNGNGTLAHQDDQRWVALRDAKVVADTDKGVYSATFSPAQKRLDGQPFTITGYMLPLQSFLRSPVFVLTRRSASCPFCPPNEPTESIQIRALTAIRYTPTPVTVSGTLRLVAHSENGLFYQIDGAKIG